MHRRALLSAIAALPVAPGLLTRTTTPPLPIEENDAWWWGFVKRAIAFPPQYCNEKYLDTAVMRSNLNHTTDQEAMRVLRAAFNGAYERSDVPSPHQD